jgi:kelch-like protein 8
MMAASVYSFPSIFEATARFLACQLHPSNCLGIRSFARTYGSEVLVGAASDYFRDHFMDAIKNEEFLSLSGEDLASLLDSDDVNVRSEEDVYRAVETWLAVRTEERVAHLPALIKVVRLPLLSTAFLTEQVEANPFVRRSLECRDYLDDAKNFHLMPDKFWQSEDRRFHPRKSTVGMLFAVGGRGAIGEPFSSVECYDFRTNSWHEGPELCSRRRHVGVAYLDGRLYAVGGHDGHQHLNSVECYDPKQGVWHYVQPMKTLRRGIAVGAIGGPMYAVGGLDDVNCYRTVERYDPQSDEWTEVCSLRSPRGGVGVATLGKYLYAAGGNDGSASLQTVERYDPHVNKWTEVAPMSKRRAGVGVVALNGYLYAVGGFDDASPLDTVERYNPQTNTWQFMSPMHVCRGGVGLSALGGYLFAVGGHDGKAYLNTAEMYCPNTNSWSPIASMATSRAGAGVIAFPHLSQNGGGYSGSTPPESLESL